MLDILQSKHIIMDTQSSSASAPLFTEEDAQKLHQAVQDLNNAVDAAERAAAQASLS